MKQRILGAAALLLLVPAATAFAGAVYIPLATDHTVEDIRYQTQIWATNTDDAEVRRFASYFIPSETDGTDRPEFWGVATAVPPGGTVLLGSVVGSGETGVLEISGSPAIVISARMVATLDGVTSLGAAMPLISSHNQFAADAVAHLQGWIRSGDLRSDFGIVNLGHEATGCAIDVFRSDGTQIQSTAVVNVPPLSHRQFDDALDILGEAAIAAVRSETSCDQPFYVYLRTYDRTTGELVFTSPSMQLAASLLDPPGTEPPPPPPAECSAGAVFCFRQDGVFHTPTRGTPVKYIDFDVPAGNYKRLRAKLSFRHGGWDSAKPAAAHNIFWLVRDRRHFNLYGYMNIFGPPKNEILWRHGLALTADQKARIVASANFQPGQLYHIDYDFDAGRRTIKLLITNDQGQTIVSLNDRPNVNNVQAFDGEPYSLGLGFFEGVNPNEVPTYGWQYSNFIAEFYN